MARDKRDGLEFVYINTSNLNILEDQALDNACPWMETAAGKKRRQFETLIIQANFILHEYIVLSTIRYFIAKLNEETKFELAVEFSTQYKENQEKQRYIQQLYEQHGIIEAKRFEILKNLERLKNIYQEEANKSHQVIRILDQKINQLTGEIKGLDVAYKKADNEIKDVHLKNYDTLLANPPEPILLNDFIAKIVEKLQLPEDHPLKTAPPIPAFDIIPLVRELKSDIQKPDFDMKNFDAHCKEKIDKHFDNHINDYVKNYTTPEEAKKFMAETKSSPEYEEKKELVFINLHQKISEKNYEKIDELKIKKAEIMDKKNEKIDQKEKLENELEAQYTKRDTLEQKIHLLDNVSEFVENQSSIPLNLEDDNSLFSSLLESLETAPFPENEPSILAKHSMFSANTKSIKSAESQPSNEDDLDNLFGKTHKPS